jgi:hypothetical protein
VAERIDAVVPQVPAEWSDEGRHAERVQKMGEAVKAIAESIEWR